MKHRAYCGTGGKRLADGRVIKIDEEREQPNQLISLGCAGLIGCHGDNTIHPFVYVCVKRASSARLENQLRKHLGVDCLLSLLKEEEEEKKRHLWNEHAVIRPHAGPFHVNFPWLHN